MEAFAYKSLNANRMILCALHFWTWHDTDLPPNRPDIRFPGERAEYDNDQWVPDKRSVSKRTPGARRLVKDKSARKTQLYMDDLDANMTGHLQEYLAANNRAAQ